MTASSMLGKALMLATDVGGSKVNVVLASKKSFNPATLAGRPLKLKIPGGAKAAAGPGGVAR